jgi:hypothetical protein
MDMLALDGGLLLLTVQEPRCDVTKTSTETFRVEFLAFSFSQRLGNLQAEKIDVRIKTFLPLAICDERGDKPRET